MRAGGEAAAAQAETRGESFAAGVAAPPAALTTEQAFKDIEAILYAIATSPAHYRNFAVHYMRCRNALLDGADRAALPGFLIQCGTSEKFREFICLYDASAAARHGFVSQALSRCRALFGGTRSYDFFDEEDF